MPHHAGRRSAWALALAVLAVASTGVVAQEVLTDACLRAILPKLAAGCEAVHSNRALPGNSSLSAVNLLGWISNCFSTTGAEPTLLAANLSFSNFIRAQNYSSVLGSTRSVEFVLSPLASWGRTLAQIGGVDPLLLGLEADAAPAPSYDGWMVDPIALVDLYDSRQLLDLSQVVLADEYKESIAWVDIHRLFRASVVADETAGTISSLPFGGLIYQMFYRHDVLAKAGLSPPSTWDDFLAVAAAVNGTDMNGDGVPDYGVCLQRPRYCFNGFSLAAIWSSFVQSQGTRQGAFFDPDTMVPLVNNSAMRAALELYVALRDYGPADETTAACLPFNLHFVRGRCALTLSWGYQVKANTFLSYSVVRDKVSVALLPGSTMVLNRTTGELQPCESRAICPFSTEEPGPNGTKPRLVNRAPYVALSTVSAGISSRAGVRAQTSLLRLFAYLSSRNVSWNLVTSPLTELGPYRYSHFAAENIDEWVRRGYPRQIISQFLSVMKAQVDSDNVMVEVRTIEAYAYRRMLDIVATAVSERSLSVPAAVGYLAEQLNAVYSPRNPRFAAMKRYYQYSIGASSATTPPAANPTASQPSNGNSSAVGIVVPIVVTGLAVLMGVVLYLFLRTRLRSSASEPQGHPGLGDDTTLCVTDVKGSTAIWEVVDAAVMDVVWTLHHECMRRTALRWNGYESQTEGDSFLIAFQTASDAVNFSLQVQQALLDVTWPPELLAFEPCRPVWLVRTGLEVPLELPWEASASGGRVGAEAAAGKPGPLVAQGSRAAAASLVPGASQSSGSQLGRLASRVRGALLRHGSRRQPSQGGTPEGVQGAECANSEGPADGATTPVRPQSLSGGPQPATDQEGPTGTSAPRGAAAGSMHPGTSIECVADALRALWREVPVHIADPSGGVGHKRWTGFKAAFRPSKARSARAPAGGAADAADAQPAAEPAQQGRLFPDSPLERQEAGNADATYDEQRNGQSASNSTNWWQPLSSSKMSALNGSTRQPAALTPAQGWEAGAMVPPSALTPPPRTPPRTPTQAAPAEGQHAAVAAAAAGTDEWLPAGIQPSQCILVHRGLKVRIGMHSGLRHATDLVYSEVAARWKYSGEILAAAKAVSDAANGGEVYISAATMGRLSHEMLLKRVCMLYMGRHVLRGGSPASVLMSAANGLHVPAPGATADLYAVHSHRLLPRLALHRRPRTAHNLGLGVLDSPVGQRLAYGMLLCHGLSELVHHESAVVHEALHNFSTIATDQLLACHGVGAAPPSAGGVGGTMAAVFRNPYHAILWALQAQDDLLSHPWSQELLAHEQFEELAMPAVAADTLPSAAALQQARGLDGGHGATPARESEPGKADTPASTARGIVGGWARSTRSLLSYDGAIASATAATAAAAPPVARDSSRRAGLSAPGEAPRPVRVVELGPAAGAHTTTTDVSDVTGEAPDAVVAELTAARNTGPVRSGPWTAPTTGPQAGFISAPAIPTTQFGEPTEPSEEHLGPPAPSAPMSAIELGPEPGAGANAGGQQEEMVLFRGPRVKGAITFGVLKAALEPLSGKVRYEGKPTAQASKMLSYASIGMVVASVEAVHAGEPEDFPGGMDYDAPARTTGQGAFTPGEPADGIDAGERVSTSQRRGAVVSGKHSRLSSLHDDPEGPSAAMAAAAAAAAAALLNLAPEGGFVRPRSASLEASAVARHGPPTRDSSLALLAAMLHPVASAGVTSEQGRGQVDSELRSSNSGPLATDTYGGGATSSGYSTPRSHGCSFTHPRHGVATAAGSSKMKSVVPSASRAARALSNLNPDSRQTSRTQPQPQRSQGSTLHVPAESCQVFSNGVQALPSTSMVVEPVTMSARANGARPWAAAQGSSGEAGHARALLPLPPGAGQEQERSAQHARAAASVSTAAALEESRSRSTSPEDMSPSRGRLRKPPRPPPPSVQDARQPVPWFQQRRKRHAAPSESPAHPSLQPSRVGSSSAAEGPLESSPQRPVSGPGSSPPLRTLSREPSRLQRQRNAAAAVSGQAVALVRRASERVFRSRADPPLPTLGERSAAGDGYRGYGSGSHAPVAVLAEEGPSSTPPAPAEYVALQAEQLQQLFMPQRRGDSQRCLRGAGPRSPVRLPSVQVLSHGLTQQPQHAQTATPGSAHPSTAYAESFMLEPQADTDFPRQADGTVTTATRLRSMLYDRKPGTGPGSEASISAPRTGAGAPQQQLGGGKNASAQFFGGEPNSSTMHASPTELPAPHYPRPAGAAAVAQHERGNGDAALLGLAGAIGPSGWPSDAKALLSQPLEAVGADEVAMVPVALKKRTTSQPLMVYLCRFVGTERAGTRISGGKSTAADAATAMASVATTEQGTAQQDRAAAAGAVRVGGVGASFGKPLRKHAAKKAVESAWVSQPLPQVPGNVLSGLGTALRRGSLTGRLAGPQIADLSRRSTGASPQVGTEQHSSNAQQPQQSSAAAVAPVASSARVSGGGFMRRFRRASVDSAGSPIKRRHGRGASAVGHVPPVGVGEVRTMSVRRVQRAAPWAAATGGQPGVAAPPAAALRQQAALHGIDVPRDDTGGGG